MQEKRLPETKATTRQQTRQVAQQRGPGVLADRFPAVSKILAGSKDTLFKGAMELETKKTKERGYKQIQRNLASLDKMQLLAEEQNILLRDIIRAMRQGEDEQPGGGGRFPRLPRGRTGRGARGRFGRAARARLQRMQAARRARVAQRVPTPSAEPDRTRVQPRPRAPAAVAQRVPVPVANDNERVRANDNERVRTNVDAEDSSRRIVAQAEEQARRITSEAEERSRRVAAEADERAKATTAAAEDTSRRIIAEGEERARTQAQEAETARSRAQYQADIIRNQAQTDADTIRSRAQLEAESIRTNAQAEAESIRTNAQRVAERPAPAPAAAEPERVTAPEPQRTAPPAGQPPAAEPERVTAPEPQRAPAGAAQPAPAEAEKVGERTVAGRTVTYNERAYNRTVQGVRIAGGVGLVIGAMGIAEQVRELYALRQMNQENSEQGITEEEFQKELANLAGSVLGGVAGGYVGAKVGGLVGGLTGGPWGALAGGVAGGILGGLQGEQAGDLIGAAIFDQLTGSNTFQQKWSAIVNNPEATNAAAAAPGAADVDAMGLRPVEDSVPATPVGDSAIQTDRRTQRRMEGIIRDLQTARRRLAANPNNRRLQQAVTEEENKLKSLLEDPRVTISDQGRRRAQTMLSSGTEVSAAAQAPERANVDAAPVQQETATSTTAQAVPPPATITHSAGEIEHITNVVRSSLTLRGQSERLEEVMNHIKQLYSRRRLPSSDFLIQSVINEYIAANPGTRNDGLQQVGEEVQRTGEEMRQTLQEQQPSPEPTQLKSNVEDLLTNASNVYKDSEPAHNQPKDAVADTDRVTAEPIVRSLLREEDIESALPYPENLIDMIGRTEFKEIEIEADKIVFDGEIKLTRKEFATLDTPAPSPSPTAPAPQQTTQAAAPPVTMTNAAPAAAGSTTSQSTPVAQSESAPALATPVALPSPAATGIAPAARAPEQPAPSAPHQQGGQGGGGDFMAQVNEVSGRLGINPANLLAVMRSESSLNPRAVNSSTGASGLIQFMPRTAQSLGTSVEAIRQMSAAEQMPFVERFFRSVRLPAGASAGKLYAYVFLPGRANREVLTQSGENFYEANRGLDVDRDGKITIADLDARLMRFGAVGGAATMQAAAPGAGGALAAAGTGMAAADQAQARSGNQTLIVQAQNQQAAQTPNVIAAQGSGREVPLNTRLQKQVA